VGSVTEQSEHLSSAQIENYGNRTSGAEPDAAQGDERQRLDHQSSDDQSMNDQRVEAHLADCPSCRNRVLDFHRHRFAMLSGPAPDAKPTDLALADSKFANPKYPADPQVRTASTPECPSDDALRQLAAGLTPENVAAKLTQHAATCNHCGPLLRTYTEIFSDDFTPEEQAALANLQSSSAAWQKNTARQMLEVAGRTNAAGDARAAGASAAEADSSRTAGTVESGEKPAGKLVSTASNRKPFFWKWTLVPATAVVVAVSAFTIWYARRDTPEKVEALLAQEYTDNRRLAMRFPKTPFAPMHVTRGAEQSRLSQSRNLLKAEGIIGKHQQEVEENIDWLQAGAKADILDGRPGAAITVLSQALSKYPDSVPLVMNLAVAHFELAETSNDAHGYQKAQELLTRALAREPGNCVARFNRAVVLGRLRRLEQAASDWKATLQCESDPAWAAEAHDNLEALINAGANR
jgi:tetratricopeptide (TPR) repeat protein